MGVADFSVGLIEKQKWNNPIPRPNIYLRRLGHVVLKLWIWPQVDIAAGTIAACKELVRCESGRDAAGNKWNILGRCIDLFSYH